MPPAATTILSASAITTLGTLPVFLLGAQAVFVMPELGFGERGLGVAVGCFFAAAATFTVVGGRLADRLGRRVSTVAAGSLSAIGGLGLAGLADSWLHLVVAMTVLGLANAACQVTANLTMATAIPSHRRGVGFGVKQAAIPLSITVAGLAVPTFSAAFGWRATYVVTGVGGLVVALVGVFVSGRPDRVRPSRAELDKPPLRALLICMTCIALASAAVNSMAAYLPSWAFEVGLTPGEAGILIAVGSAINVTSRIFGGHRADRRQGRNLTVVATLMGIGSVALALFSVPEAALLVPAALVALGIGWSWPGLLLFAVVRLSRDAPGTASGIVQGGAFTGGAAGPFLFGMLVDAAGYPIAWRVVAVVLGVAGALALVARQVFLADLAERPPREPIPQGVRRRRRTGQTPTQ